MRKISKEFIEKHNCSKTKQTMIPTVEGYNVSTVTNIDKGIETISTYFVSPTEAVNSLIDVVLVQVLRDLKNGTLL